jgi:hypothetical protein
MEAALTSLQQADAKQAREVLDRMALPPELDRIETEIKNDADGQLALYLSFQVKDGATLDRESIPRLSRFMISVLDALLRSGISLFPYASLDQAA